MTSWDKFKETQLPAKESFHSKLYMSGISDKDYEHAQKVWSVLDMKNLEEYHDRTRLEYYKLRVYKLYPAHFYTSPGLAWQACLKKTVVRLELLTDPDMLLMFEKGIRGGIMQLRTARTWVRISTPRRIVASYNTYM